MTDRVFRVGLVGCGFFAPNHAHAWASLPGVEIAGLCDSQPGRAAALAGRLGRDVPAFEDLDEMVERARPDFLDLVTGPETHPALVRFAAERGLPAIVQKPMALAYADAEAMVAAMERAGVAFMVHENFRFQAPVARLGAILRSGRIGEPTYAHIAFRTAHDIYAGQPYLARLERFVLADVGVHVLDVARFLLGEADRVSCETVRVKPGIAGEDVATVLLRHASGAIGVVECSYASPLPEELFPQVLIQVEGTAGSVRLSAGYRIAVRSGDAVEEFAAEPDLLPWAARPWHVVQDSVRRTQEHWLDCLRRGAEPQTSGRDNLRTLALVEAAYRSAGDRAVPAG